MANKDGSKSGGRVKGSIAKKTAEMQEKVTKYKWHPFDVLMMYANRDHKALELPEYKVVGYSVTGEPIEALSISAELQVSSAKGAMEYVAQKLKAVEHAVDDETLEQIVSIEEYLKTL